MKVGDSLVHVQKGIPIGESFEPQKAVALALGKALVAKLAK